MKVSELINELTQLKTDHGDLEVMTTDECGYHTPYWIRLQDRKGVLKTLTGKTIPVIVIE